MLKQLKAAYQYFKKDVREVASDIVDCGKALMLSVGVGVTAITVPTADVHAALPASLTASYATATDNFTSLFDLFIPGMVLIASSLLIWRYGKRFLGKL